jgi:hypothetical protein
MDGVATHARADVQSLAAGSRYDSLCGFNEEEVGRSLEAILR